MIAIRLKPCAGEAELADPAVTGAFAAELAAIGADAHVPPWCGYIGRGDEGAMGFIGFKSSPDPDGAVELGYLTFPRCEGRGVATAMTAAMLAVAADNGAVTVVAHTLPEANASSSVLRRNGFVRTGAVADPEEGMVWRWERRLGA